VEGRHVCLVERLARLVVDLKPEVEFTNVRLMFLAIITEVDSVVDPDPYQIER
jgi:hypothetical protein